jgi:hypothetical protein
MDVQYVVSCLSVYGFTVVSNAVISNFEYKEEAIAQGEQRAVDVGSRLDVTAVHRLEYTNTRARCSGWTIRQHAEAITPR